MKQEELRTYFEQIQDKSRSQQQTPAEEIEDMQRTISEHQPEIREIKEQIRKRPEVETELRKESDLNLVRVHHEQPLNTSSGTSVGLLNGDLNVNELPNTNQSLEIDPKKSDEPTTVILTKKELNNHPSQLIVTQKGLDTVRTSDVDGAAANNFDGSNVSIPAQSIQPTLHQSAGFIQPSRHFIPGAQMSYFSPKRFNRFPRFSTIMKGFGLQQYDHLAEKTVCLNSEILGLVSENHEFVEHKHQSSTTFDPFEKVILIKDIDNQILTSFRTLRGDNNSVSDTQKIIHRKFMGNKQPNSRFYKSHAGHLIHKLQYEQIDEDIYHEESV